MNGRSGTADRFVRDKFGGLPRAYWALWGGTLVNRLGTMVQPFFAFYLTGTRHLPVAEVGVVLTMFGAGALFSQVMSGWLSDRVGRRVTLTVGMFATGTFMLLLGYSTSVSAIAVWMLLLGLAMDVYRPASSALIADMVPPRDRVKAFGLLFWAVNLGFTGGVLTGGWLAQGTIQALFWIDALSCMAFGLIVWFATTESRPEAAGRARGGSFADVLRDRVMVAFVLVTLAYGVVYLQSLITLPLAMRQRGLSSSAFGMVMALNSVIIVVLQPLVVGWLARHDPSRVVAVGMGLAGLGFGLTTFAATVAGFAVTVVVWSVGEVVFTAVSAAIATDLAPAPLRGRYSGAYGFAWSLSNLLAPALGTRLFAHSPGALWLSCGALCLLAAIGQLLLGPAIRQRAAALATV